MRMPRFPIRVSVHAAGIAGDVKPRNTDCAARASKFHQRIEDRRRPLHGGVVAMSAGFEPDTVYRRIDDRLPGNLRDLIPPTWHLSRRSIVSQPKLFACASRSGIMSPTMTTAAPRR